MRLSAWRALALALIVARWLFADMEDPGLAAVWALLALLCCLPLLWSTAPTLQRASGLWAAGGLALWQGLSVLWSEDPGRSLAVSLVLCACCGLALGMTGLRDPWRRLLAWSVLIGAALVSAIALRQALLGFPALREAIAAGTVIVEPRVERTALAGRVFGSFFAPDMLAGALVVALPVGLGLLWTEHAARRVLAAICSLLVCIALILTRSVGGGFALLSVALPIAGWKLLSLSSRRAALITAVLGVLVAILVAAPRIQGATRRAQERFHNQAVAFGSLVDAPVRGHGADTFGLVSSAVHRHNVPLTRYAHGLLGQSASDGGAVGLLLAVGLVFGLLWHVVARFRAPEADPLALAAGVGLLAGLAHGLIDYDLLFGENQLVLWCAAALTVGPASEARRDRRHLVLVPIAVVALALTCWSASAQVLRMASDQATPCADKRDLAQRAARWLFIDAELARHVAIVLHSCPELGAVRAPQAADWMRRAVERRPGDAILRAEYAVSLAVVHDAAGTWRQIALARQAWPQVARIVALEAQAAAILGDSEHAQQSLERAIEMSSEDPVVQQVRRRLAPLSRPAAGESP
ncbi:MAG: hypothetical protein ABIJ09_26280 [Pseudomonadota bacterium]